MLLFPVPFLFAFSMIIAFAMIFTGLAMVIPGFPMVFIGFA